MVLCCLVPLNEPYLLKKYVPAAAEVRSTLESYFKAHEGCKEVTPSSGVIQPSTSTAAEGLVWTFITPETARSDSSVNSESAQEVADYLSEGLEDPLKNPLEYWRNNSGKFPVLARMAREFLGFPASSGGVERLFSISGSLCRARRAALKMETVSNMLLYREARTDG